MLRTVNNTKTKTRDGGGGLNCQIHFHLFSVAGLHPRIDLCFGPVKVYSLTTMLLSFCFFHMNMMCKCHVLKVLLHLQTLITKIQIHKFMFKMSFEKQYLFQSYIDSRS